jgi:hypothetical protein
MASTKIKKFNIHGLGKAIQTSSGAPKQKGLCFTHA